MRLEDINAKEKEDQNDPLAVPLTKSAHRNPDIHQRGDTLPESLLEYQEGSATVNPDIAGNTPLMLRSKALAQGTGVTQNATTSYVTVAGLSLTITCPIQATGSPFVEVAYNLGLCQTGGRLAGAALNAFLESVIVVNGVIFGQAVCRWKNPDHNILAYGYGNAAMSATADVPINPGQTLTIDVRIATNTLTTPDYNYSVVANSDRATLLAKLYY